MPPGPGLYLGPSLALPGTRGHHCPHTWRSRPRARQRRCPRVASLCSAEAASSSLQAPSLPSPVLPDPPQPPRHPVPSASLAGPIGVSQWFHLILSHRPLQCVNKNPPTQQRLAFVELSVCVCARYTSEFTSVHLEACGGCGGTRPSPAAQGTRDPEGGGHVPEVPPRLGVPRSLWPPGPPSLSLVLSHLPCPPPPVTWRQAPRPPNPPPSTADSRACLGGSALPAGPCSPLSESPCVCPSSSGGPLGVPQTSEAACLP